jgi:Outer membrane lipoprotein
MKHASVMIVLLVCLVFAATTMAFAAPYERNVARQVNQVVFGKVESARNITQTQVIESQQSGWKTLGGALLGGLIGNQFGSGHGREIATAVGALAGAGTVQSMDQGGTRQYQLVELLIQSEQGKLINVIQDYDASMVFTQGDRVRILYFDDGVRVDKSY